jgi:hypothetical protein
MWFIALLPPPPTPITFITFDWFLVNQMKYFQILSCSSFYLFLIFIIIFDLFLLLGAKGKQYSLLLKLLALSKKSLILST